MGPIWFRPANEMNGSWTPYYGDPTNYVKAWRRMYNIAEQLGVTAYNVFVWSPNSVSMPGTGSKRNEKLLSRRYVCRLAGSKLLSTIA